MGILEDYSSFEKKHNHLVYMADFPNSEIFSKTKWYHVLYFSILLILGLLRDLTPVLEVFACSPLFFPTLPILLVLWSTYTYPEEQNTFFN